MQAAGKKYLIWERWGSAFRAAPAYHSTGIKQPLVEVGRVLSAGTCARNNQRERVTQQQTPVDAETPALRQ
jgi:hypothetical protein